MKNKTKPIKKQQATDFNGLISMLAGQFNPLQIYQFGFRQQLASHESVFMANELVETQHYYLLMIISSENKIENGVQECVNQNLIDNTATVLVHGLASIRDALAQQNEFFSRIVGEGKLIYDKGISLVPCLVNNEVRQNLAAVKGFAIHKISMALGYVNGAGACLEIANYNVCICLLHQALEQTCLALLRVFLDYRPNGYQLGKLLNLISCFNVSIGQTFMASEDTEELFKLLCRSYAKGRYSEGFSIKEIEATRLQELVWSFVRLAKEFCECKVKIDETVC